MKCSEVTSVQLVGHSTETRSEEEVLIIVTADCCGARYETEAPPLNTIAALTETAQNTGHLIMSDYTAKTDLSLLEPIYWFIHIK